MRGHVSILAIKIIMSPSESARLLVDSQAVCLLGFSKLEVCYVGLHRCTLEAAKRVVFSCETCPGFRHTRHTRLETRDHQTRD